MKIPFVAFSLLSISVLASCSSSESDEYLSGSTMGTSYSVNWTSADDFHDVELLQNAIDNRLTRINQLMSTYDENSQLSEFNQSREKGWHLVDLELAQLIKLALEICRQSNGAFDVTIGPLVKLWSLGADDTKFSYPTDSELSITQQNIGCQYLDVRLDPPAIYKDRVGLYVDLSAIAKGYGVDQIAKILDEFQLNSYLVEIGGELKAKGLATHGEPWRVGIEAPNFGRSNIEEVISLDNHAIATSGDYRDYTEHEGKQYSHIIDPRSGKPIEHSLTTVTVIHKSAAIADAWATALLVLGPNRALEIAEQLELAIFMITREGIGVKSTFNKKMKPNIAN
ncbi:MAG: FAD:protein FMN transferase [Pseudomonadota bacterium]